MGKKNKKENKGKGKEKTALKTEKKAQKRTRKELAEKGEEDIEDQVAELRRKVQKRTEIIEEKCAAPSPRCNTTLVPHPERDELVMFGGEHFTGNHMTVYDDLYFYNIKKNDWTKVICPNSPPPRSSHQAVSLPQDGGQMWIFGGEYSSNSQLQFYHYKELWVFRFKDKSWERISAVGGPSARSGHRMVAVKKQLIVFGGFHDNTRDYKYYNDVHAFNLDSYTWTKVEVSGLPPCPRSGHVMAAISDQLKIVVYGGYSKERLKKEADKGTTHSDMYSLMPEGRSKEVSPTKWRWQSLKQTGSCPPPSSGLSLAVAPGNKAVLFGGVHDQLESEEQLEGVFSNNLVLLDLEKHRWHDVCIRSKKDDGEMKKRRRKPKMDEAEAMDESENTVESAGENMEQLSLQLTDGSSTTYDDGIFKVTVKNQDDGGDIVPSSPLIEEVELFKPPPRMNAAMTVKNGVLYLYGGMYEVGVKQVTMADFYSLDLQKLEEWKVLIADDTIQQKWEESDSSEDDEDDEEGACGGDDDDSSGSDSEDMEFTFDDAPPISTGETLTSYFERSQDYWLVQANIVNKKESLDISEKKIGKFAKELCKSAFTNESQR